MSGPGNRRGHRAQRRARLYAGLRENVFAALRLGVFNAVNRMYARVMVWRLGGQMVDADGNAVRWTGPLTTERDG